MLQRSKRLRLEMTYATLNGIIKAYYDVVTVKKGEKVNYERDSVLHVHNAMVGKSEKDKDGKENLY